MLCFQTCLNGEKKGEREREWGVWRIGVGKIGCRGG